jgi:hypothetical protein
MRQKSPYSLRGLIKSALQSAKMERVDFQELWTENVLPKTEGEVTEFIRKRTELYRNSHIIKPLQMALEKIEKKKRANDD